MDIIEIFAMLDDVSPLRRSKAIEELRTSVKETGGHLLFGNVKKVFSVLNSRLRDNNWNVAHQAILFTSELFHTLGPDCRSNLSIILPTLVDNLGDRKVVIRKASLHVLRELLQLSDCVGLVVSTYLRSGLENDDWRVRQESVHSLCAFLGDASPPSLDVHEIMAHIIDRLRDPSTVVVQAAEEAIFGLVQLFGEEAVNVAVKRLGTGSRTLFAEHYETIMKNLMGLAITPASDTLLQYGFIQINLLNQLRDSKNWTVRAAGIDELQRVVSALSNVAPAVPHLPALMELFAVLLGDQNFKISLTTLQILNQLVVKFGVSLEPALEVILPHLVGKLGDNKIVVKQGVMKFMRNVITHVNPRPVFLVVLGHAEDKHHKVREEVLNIVTVALALSGNECEFDYAAIVVPLCRALYDVKNKVTRNPPVQLQSVPITQ
jgi:hypothetical protein